MTKGSQWGCSGRLEDTQESFFLAETLKYLYLLFADGAGLLDYGVFSTEGHWMTPGAHSQCCCDDDMHTGL